MFDGVLKLLRCFTTVRWKHVLGHNADPRNGLADAIAHFAYMGLAPTVPDDFQPWYALGGAAAAAVPWLLSLIHI
eukprot:6803660-Pyramimonas_sp.AAC.1